MVPTVSSTAIPSQRHTRSSHLQLSASAYCGEGTNRDSMRWITCGTKERTTPKSTPEMTTTAVPLPLHIYTYRGSYCDTDSFPYNSSCRRDDRRPNTGRQQVKRQWSPDRQPHRQRPLPTIYFPLVLTTACSATLGCSTLSRGHVLELVPMLCMATTPHNRPVSFSTPRNIGTHVPIVKG